MCQCLLPAARQFNRSSNALTAELEQQTSATWFFWHCIMLQAASKGHMGMITRRGLTSSAVCILFGLLMHAGKPSSRLCQQRGCQMLCFP